LVLESDELLALDDTLVLAAFLRHPPLAVVEAVVGVGLDGGRDVRRQRPRRRRPDDERFALAGLQRKAHEEGRVLELLVLAREELVLGDRGSAAGAPRRRAVALVQPAA